MDYEQKYNDALERAQRLYEQGTITESLGFVFPELKNEDDKIRKDIISYLRNEKIVKRYISDIEIDKWIAWLEKQGNTSETFAKWSEEDEQMILSIEQVMNCASLLNIVPEKIDNIKSWLKSLRPKKQQKPIEKQDEQQGKSALEAIKEERVDNQNCVKNADKVEPKFHEGEWLCENKPNNYARFIQILETVNAQGKGRYRISRDIHNDEDIVDFGFVEEYYHKFAIQDAKDGDVLVTGEMVFIFNKIHGEWVNCHCSLHSDNSLYTEDYDLLTTKYAQEIFPATKKQRDLLFSKIKQAGYEWDANKKELKKIEHKMLDIDKVIAWLVANICDFEYYVKRFKQDFGI